MKFHVLQQTISGAKLVPKDIDIVYRGSRAFAKFPYNPKLVKAIKTFEGASWDPDNKLWRFTHPDKSARNRYRMKFFANELTKQEKLRQFYDEDAVLPDGLFQHQDDCIRTLIAQSHIAAHDLGLGKTRSTIETLKLSNPKYLAPGYTWIICPRVVKQVWRHELRKWGYPTTPKILTNSYQAIEEAMNRAQFWPKILVLDESVAFKNPGAKRTQLIKQVAEKAEQVYLLTGIISPKNPSDWWMQAELVCPGYLPFKNQQHMLYEVGHVEQEAGYPRVTGWKKDVLDQLRPQLKRIAHIRLKEDCLDLPEQQFTKIYAEPSESTLARCRDIINNTAQPRMKLRQISDGFLYTHADTDTDDEGPYHVDNRAKVEALRDYMSTYEHNRVVVFAAFKVSIDMICELFLDLGWGVIRVDGRGSAGYFKVGGNDLEGAAFARHLETNPTMETFQNEENKLLTSRPIAWVANPATARYGLTLTASPVLIYYSNTEDYDHRGQSLGRNHRIGTKGSLAVDIIHTPIDEMILESLEIKESLDNYTKGRLVDEYAVRRFESLD
jgi:SNF2 family DNA or RNA helicase